MSNHQGKHIANKQQIASFPFLIFRLSFSLSSPAAFYSTPARSFDSESLLQRVYTQQLPPLLPCPLICLHHHTRRNLPIQSGLFLLFPRFTRSHSSTLFLLRLVRIVKHRISGGNLRVFGEARGIGSFANHFKAIVRFRFVFLLLLFILCGICGVCGVCGFRFLCGGRLCLCFDWLVLALVLVSIGWFRLWFRF